jgi:hypothetical protein
MIPRQMTSDRLGLALFSVMLMCFCVGSVLATEPVGPNPLPPGYIQGGGPSGFEVRDLPNARLGPDPNKPMLEAPDHTRGENPNGDTAPPGVPTIDAPSGPRYQQRKEGTVRLLKQPQNKKFSLHAITHALDAAASKSSADARPFGYAIRFYPKNLYPTAADLPSCDVDGLYEYPSDQFRFQIFSWHGESSGGHLLTGYGSGVFHPGQGCFGAIPGPTLLQPLPEPIGEHPPMPKWSIDFPQILAVLRKNEAFFANGVETLHLTTAQRLKVEDGRPVGCTGESYQDNPKYQRLSGIADTRAVMEIVEVPKQIPPRRDFAGCVVGHYLILDAVTGATIERGPYRRCPFIPA